MIPLWAERLVQARRTRSAGAMLGFNTADRVFWQTDGRARLASLQWFLAEHLADEKATVGVFSLGTGFRLLTPPSVDSAPESPLEALTGEEHPLFFLRRLDRLLRDPNAPVTVIIDHAEHIAGATAGSGDASSNEQAAAMELLFGWSLDDDIKHAGSFIVLVSRGGELHPLLRRESGFTSIQIGLPETTQRRDLTRFLLRARADGRSARLGALAADLGDEEFARISGGLRFTDVETLFLEAADDDRGVTREAVRRRKRQTVQQMCGDVVEVIEPTRNFGAVAGCRGHLEYFRSLAPAWRAGRGSMPPGILLSGPPGGGKSFLVRALAAELESPCLALRNVREQWVGASERNMERVLRVVESIAPCVVWVDEIDQQVGGERSGGPSGDSGVNQRLFGRLLEFFGEGSVRGRALWVGTTNRPDLLDTAMLDRFPVRIPFLHPTAQERGELLPALAEQVGRKLAKSASWQEAANDPALDRLSARALQEIVVWAGSLADRRTGETGGEIGADDLRGAVADYRPLSDTLRDELMALYALKWTPFHSLLPWVGQSGFRAGEADWPVYLDGIVDPEDGRLIPERLNARIALLQRTRAGTGH